MDDAEYNDTIVDMQDLEADEMHNIPNLAEAGIQYHGGNPESVKNPSLSLSPLFHK